MRKRFGHILIPLMIGFAAAAAAHFLGSLGVVRNLELMTVDRRFNTRGKRDPGKDIVIAAIDDESQQGLSSVWPFPRDWNAQLITNLNAAGAKAVNFDVFFDTPDKKNPGSDAVFARAINRAMSPTIRRKETSITLGGMLREINEASGQGVQIVMPTQALYDTKKHFGVVNQPLDNDEKVRKSSLLVNVPEFGDNLRMPSFSLETSARFLGLEPETLINDHYKTKTRALFNIGDNRSLQTESEGRSVVFPINYYGPPKTFPTYSYQDFLLMKLDPSIVLGTDSDGDGKADNAQNFHTLLDTQDQLLPPMPLGSFTNRSLLSLVISSAFSAKSASFYTAEFDLLNDGRCIIGVQRATPAKDSAFGSMHVERAGKITLRENICPTIIEPVNDGRVALSINAYNGDLIEIDLQKKKIVRSAALPEKAKQQYNSFLESIKSRKDIDAFFATLYSDMLSSIGILYNPLLHQYIVNLPGVKDLVFYDEKTFTSSLFTDSGEFDYLPKKVRQSADGENIFILTADSKLLKLSMQDMTLTDFTPAALDAANEKPAAISDIEYFWFDHPPSRKLKNDTLVKEKIYALDRGQNRVIIFDANTLAVIGRVSVPEERFRDEIADEQSADPEYPDDTKMAAMSLGLSQKLGKVYVAFSGYSREAALKSAKPYRKPYVFMTLDPYTDLWLSDSQPLELRPFEGSFTSSGGRLMILGRDDSKNNVFKYMLFDGLTPIQKYRALKMRAARGKIVLVGPTAEALHDTFATPFFNSQRTPGVEIHANAIQNIIDGDFLRVVEPGSFAGLFILIFFAATAAFLAHRIITRLSMLVALLSFMGLLVFWVFVAWMLFINFSIDTAFTLIVAAAAIAIYAKLYDRFSKTPSGRKMRFVAKIVRAFLNPAACALFILSSASMLPATAIGAALVKRKALGFATGNVYLWVFLAAYLAISELIPFVMFTLTAKPAGFGSDGGAKKFSPLSYRSSDIWHKTTMSAFMAIVFFVGAAALLVCENYAGVPLASRGLNIFAPLAKNYLVPVINPCMAATLSFIVTTLFVAMTAGKEKKEIAAMFSKYVSADVVNMIMDNPGAFKLGGDKQELSILFSDIRNFTSIAETREPEAVVAFLNEYLTEMTNIVVETKGTLDKFIGDAIMCFWGAPLPQEDHKLRAVRTAVKMLKSLESLKKTWVESGKDYPPIEIGIGIHSAKVVVGNIGSDLRMDYTVIGDGVNIASRLEGQCKTYSVRLVVSETVHDAVKDLVWSRKLDDIAVKGKREPVTIYEIFDFKDDAMLNG